ncbi:hypothetical protein BBD42_18885 [Paenibacillus sp. BIHB 4019]|uniref:AraC family transcriptional regulator n=2 Tax=Paenibacillus sp. BIHB 4019 TaxID=1870819 RepID=A0A1B2DKS4_9BACL|nr:hypothetical protein BBD42_18885 [Paenibacillus sp. BIHB 4019]
MNWNEYALLWNQAAAKVIDIRFRVMEEEEGASLSYLLPSSVFLFASRGSADVRLDGEPSRLHPFHVLHGGKGANLEIMPAAEEFAFYLVFYKAIFPFTVGNALHRLADERKPFHSPFQAVPHEPLSLYDKLNQMNRLWHNGQALDQLKVKSLFYDCVHELLRQLSVNGSLESSPDLVQQTIRYLHEHYQEAITMESLAQLLDCSISYISRIFKAKVGTSPHDYLIQVRVEQAKKRLSSSELSLQSIAQSVGYDDVYYFSRLFKKHMGVSPLKFKKRIMKEKEVQFNPLTGSRFSIVQGNRFLYSDNENHYYQRGEVHSAMSRNTKPSFAAVMLLCLTLLISACQTGGNQLNHANNSAAQTQSPAASPAISANGSNATEDGQQAAETRMFKHLHGETEIPSHPKRIVTAFHLGQMMALGVKPLGTSTYILQNPVLDTKDIEDVGVPLDLEKILDLEPDLIILIDAYVEMSGGYDAFAKIAPTIVIEPYYDPVKDITLMGDILGKVDEAQQWIKDFEEKVAVSKQKVSEVIAPDETFTIMSVFDKATRIYKDQNMGGNILYKYLGLKPQERIVSDFINNEAQTAPYMEISAEVIPEFVGDHLVVSTYADNKEAFESFKGTAIWDKLEAVKNNKVYMLDYDLFLQSDPVAVKKQLELLTEMLVNNNK